MKLMIATIILALTAGVMFGLAPASAQSSEPESIGVRFIQVFADPVTGCQYLTAWRNAVTPRIAADGKTQMGCKAAQP